MRLEFTDDALKAIAQKAIKRNTGARGLRSIVEACLLDLMFEIPGMEGVESVAIDRGSVEGTAKPKMVYAQRKTA